MSELQSHGIENRYKHARNHESQNMLQIGQAAGLIQIKSNKLSATLTSTPCHPGIQLAIAAGCQQGAGSRHCSAAQAAAL
jgi:hypothetical protein